MRIFLLLFVFVFSSVFGQQAKKIPVTLSKFNFSYVDDYAWLENLNDPEVKSWVTQQNEITQPILDEAVKSNNFLFKIKDYNYLSTNGLPSKIGKYFYTSYRLDKDKPSVLHYTEKLNDMPKELVNPYRVYKDKNVFMLNFNPSKNSKILAYKMSVNGSDRHQIRFVDIPNQEYLDDVITDVKFSSLVWKGDEGIFYKRNGNKNFTAKDSTFQLFYHVVGDVQENDKLVFDATKSEGSFSFFSQDDKFFLIETNKEETSKTYYYINQSGDNDFALVPFVTSDELNFDFVKYRNGFVYCKTDKYPWGSLSKFNINNPTEISTVIPQYYNQLLLDCKFFGKYIIAKYKVLGKYHINVFDLNGTFIRKFEAPYGMNFSVRFYDEKKDDLYVVFYSHTISFLNYRLNVTTGESRVYYNDFIRPKPTLFPFDYFDYKTITYKSRDNKDVPITIVHKKGLELNGNNPTLLKAYGGFGSVSYPTYDVGLLHFLDKGGVYAYAEVRGGGDKGDNWHKSGMGQNKMNCFNDFIDAAEFLISEGYTSPNKLAINGGSHGGLLVGVAMTQRPELFKLAIPEVGVFDMFKFEEYTVGRFHVDEFGSVDKEDDFVKIMEYSPLHNIKEDINYPTTLIVTGENDDRVPPIHSYKFAAKLQNRKAQKNPIYLLVNENAGHYGKVSTYNNRVKYDAEFYSFIWEELNK